MKRNIFLSILVASVCVCGLVPSAQAECSNATLRGRYVFHTDGTVLPAGTRRVNLAYMIFDGAGHFNNRFIVNDNGMVTRSSLTSTYQVNADCRGFTAGSGDVGTLIVLENGEEFFIIRTDNLILLGFGKRLGPARGDEDHDGDD